MNTLTSAWYLIYRRTSLAAVGLWRWPALCSRRFEEKRAIERLERLPRHVLDDIGLRRGELALVVQSRPVEAETRRASHTGDPDPASSDVVLTD